MNVDLKPVTSWTTSVVGSKKNIGGGGAFAYLSQMEGIDPNYKFAGLVAISIVWLLCWGFADGMSRKYAPKVTTVTALPTTN